MDFMGRSRSVAVVVASVTTFVTVSLTAYGPTSAYGDAAGAVVTVPDPDRICAGDTATVAWTPPNDAPNLRGFEIEQSTFWSYPVYERTVVGPEERSLAVDLWFGVNGFRIRSITASGVDPTPFATASVYASRPPQPMTWKTYHGPNTVGDSSATVTFSWGGPVETWVTGGFLTDTVRVTASPGGNAVDALASIGGPHHVTVEFNGLSNGVPYTFSAVTSNVCGSSEARGSAVFTPGIAPTWTRSTPPLTTRRGHYVYKFTASGDPAPTFALVGAPPWLSISPNGMVRGRVPAGTTSFTYSVVASNGVGAPGPLRTDITAGPFTVEAGRR